MTVEETMTFAKSIAAFRQVEISEVVTRLAAGEDITVFLGRATCPYCRRFAPKLAKVARQEHKDIFFVDSENSTELADLQVFRERYGLATVPALLISRHQEIKAVCDSSLTEEAILAFLEQ
ncbi:conjugal transfer protein TraF [Streptococcus equi subsp. zooepidemicus]|uniref:thioredoxin domain-containing protein n=1 Tax=Streptococcus equi TaxID=1336 RepID=UPI0013F5EB6F|nr:thioredoxin domain-containing protein [Streptococcus equi]MCD3411483.1 conjugal transfer protein TraF [Streptococcus equi subsp. zooepidemicus]MCD3432947.1 conjugal transfer protein TraF [Streptococcus equi subsp. zooepidemicus]MCD3453705.1 conjugal transfer protein TraF [Streptococcus equi subsp. zooepidemicus]MDI5954459.1 conjugal transfer protein TraF [Streptococcus equi subsp. zooepidemicus]MDI6075503.1 conjugal transfer protein TraF [Streptococcus equi subsp. zooepidemicus]